MGRSFRLTAALTLLPLLSGCGLIHAGVFAPVHATGGPCDPIVSDEFAGGAEDIAVDYEQRRIYISVDDRRGDKSGGAIYAMSFDDVARRALPMRVSPQTTNPFRPHGIGLWIEPDGARRLFVINHFSNEVSSVDVFDADESGQLTLRQSLQSNQMHSPNDVAPTGPTSFYATNDRGDHGPVWRAFAALFGLDTSSVVYVDGPNSIFAEQGLDFANGIIVSNDGQRVYVAETGEAALGQYTRLPDNTLQLERRLDVGVGPDNLVLGEDGRIWIAAHDRFVDFLWHGADAGHPSPSRAFAVGADWSVEPNAFQTEGNDLSAISVAAPVENELVLGAVFSSGVLVCPIGN